MTTSPRRPVLILIDDDDGVCDVVGRAARRAGFDVLACPPGERATAVLASRLADLAVVGLRAPGGEGAGVLRAIRSADPLCQVVLMTGPSTTGAALDAIKLGARDYLTKPLDLDRLDQLFEDVREEHGSRQGVLTIEGDLARQLEFGSMVGPGPVMQELFSLVRRVAPHFRSALITGETGSGKELVARALHSMGQRRDRRFVAIDCAAAGETSFETELFGHVGGALTGAADRRAGLFELAENGTLFLDEVGALPLRVQARVLRLLDLAEASRVGSLASRRIDVQVIAATNRDLATAVAANRFRSDLYNRLSIVRLRVPALRDRREDIPYLAAFFIREVSRRLEKPLIGLTIGAERLLHAASWPGNVRELRSVIERACILADGDLISERDIEACVSPRSIDGLPGRCTDAGETAVPAAGGSGAVEPLAVVERDYVRRALQQSHGNKKAAARMLGLSRRAFYRRLERYQLDAVIQRRSGVKGLSEAVA